MKSETVKFYLHRTLTLYLPLAFFLGFTLLPIFWIGITAIKPSSAIIERPIRYIPQNPTLIHFFKVWSETNFPTYFMNSVIVAVVTGLFTVAAAMFGGYSLARFRYHGKGSILMFFLLTQMFPFVLLTIPLYVIFSQFGLIDTRIALIIAYTAFNVPFCTIMMQGFFEGVPPSIEECAMVDGAGLMQTLFRITFPLVLPGIAATFIFAFIFAWNELLLAVMFINSEALKTIPVGLNGFIQKYNILWGQMSAAGTMALIPALLLFFFAQKQLVKGLTLGAVKG